MLSYVMPCSDSHLWLDVLSLESAFSYVDFHLAHVQDNTGIKSCTWKLDPSLQERQCLLS